MRKVEIGEMNCSAPRALPLAAERAGLRARAVRR